MFKCAYGGAKQTQAMQKAQSYMRMHVCNIQNKHLLCVVTSLLAVLSIVNEPNFQDRPI